MDSDSKTPRIIQIILDITLGRIIEFALGFVLSSLIPALIAMLATEQLPTIAKYNFYVIPISALCGAFIFTYLFRRFNRNVPRYKHLNFNFRVDKKEIIFEFKENSNGDKAIYTKGYILKPLKKNLKVFEDKYSWTGNNCSPPVSIKLGHEYKLKERKGIWQLYNVEFDTFLKKNYPEPIEAKWELNDVSKATPFIGVTIEQPTKKLVLKLIVPKDLKITYINCETLAGIGVLIGCAESERKQPDKEGNFEWIIKNPKLLYYYEMNWRKPNKNERITNNPT